MRLRDRVRMYFQKPVEPPFETTLLEDEWWYPQAGPYRRWTFLQAFAGTMAGFVVGGLIVATWRWAHGMPWQLPKHFVFGLIIWQVCTQPFVWNNLLKRRKFELIRSKRLQEAMLLKDPGDFT